MNEPSMPFGPMAGRTPAAAGGPALAALLAAAQSQVRAPLGQARGLPNACYVDPDYHALEAERLFARRWVCVGVGAEIPDAGDIRPVTLAGRPILLVRDRDGRVNIFHNVCPHRGTQLAVEPGRHRPVIRCPYHSWTYGLDGALLHTPMVGGPGVHDCPGLDRSRLSLRPVRAAMWHDFIFADLSGQAPDLAVLTRGLDARWAPYDFSLLRHGHTRTYSFETNWKLALENFLESYHLPWVHPELNRVSPLDQHDYAYIDSHAFGAVTREYRAAEIAGSPLTPFPGLTEAQARIGEYPMLFPNLMLGIQRDHFWGIIVEPLACGRTVEHLHLYFIGDSDADSAPAIQATKQHLIDGWDEIVREDVGIVERMQMGRASAAFDGGVLTPYHDGCTITFMRLCAEAMTADGAPA